MPSMLSTLRAHGARRLRENLVRVQRRVQMSKRFSSASSSSHKNAPNATSQARGGSKSSPNSRPSTQPSWSPRPIIKWAGAAAGIHYGLKYLAADKPVDVTIQEMMRDYLVKGYVERIYIVNRTHCRVIIKSGAPESIAGKVLQVEIGSLESFESKVDEAQKWLGLEVEEHVPIQYVTETTVANALLPHLPTLLILGSLFLVGRSVARGFNIPPSIGGAAGNAYGRSLFSFGKAPGANKAKSAVKFADVAGLRQAKKEVAEFVDFLKQPKRYEQLGARVPKGGLLVGPPGTGKTLLAKAVAGEAGVPFFAMSGSEFIEMFSGVGPSRVRDLFQQARAVAPSIVFIDEIDAIGRKRGSGSGMSGGSSQERENTLNQLLVEMDGFASSSNVIVLAGTNRADILDDALKRPGRFDRQIPVDKPDVSEREEIFKVHLKPVTLHETLDQDSVASRMASLTPGFAGADIANICNEAAIFAARRNSTSVEMIDFELATERVIGGLEKRGGFMSDAEKRTVALHESGHAVAGWLLKHAEPLLKVSIVPRSSGALGFAQYLPRELSLYSKDAILDKIAVTLAGRAAEELFAGHVTTGATDDLHKVTKMAYSMVATYGMNSEVGLLSYGERSASEQFYKPYSEETGKLIDREVKSIVDEQYVRVKALLMESKGLVDKMADALAAKETLVLSELQDLLGERPCNLNAADA